METLVFFSDFIEQQQPPEEDREQPQVPEECVEGVKCLEPLRTETE